MSRRRRRRRGRGRRLALPPALFFVTLVALLLARRLTPTRHRAAGPGEPAGGAGTAAGRPDDPRAVPIATPPATAAGDRALLDALASDPRVTLRRTRVARVVDGDTVIAGDGARIRLVGIDSPEHDAPLFRAAREATRALVEGRRVTLAAQRAGGEDRHGRLLAVLFTGRDTGGRREDAGEAVLCINIELVRRGLARVYLKEPGALSAALEPDLVEAQNGAIDRRAGMWSSPGALAPGRVVATRHRFHRPGCRHIGGRRGPLVDREKCLREGKSPCRTCMP